MAVLKRAQRKRVKLKIGMAGGPGSGKSLSSILLAYGIVKREHPGMSDDDIWGHIAIIDTENHSAELYADREIAGQTIGEFCTVAIEPPFTSEKYLEAIKLCGESDIYVTVIDSLTHLWDGEGGAKDKQANIAKRTGNSFTSWREPKAEFKRVVDKILQTDMHFIVTMRSKVEYAQENVNGKTVVRKVGMNPIVADGTDYEFSIVFDLDADHVAMASKDRTGMFDGQYFKITKDVGGKLVDWLNTAKPAKAPDKVVAETENTPAEPEPEKISEIDGLIQAITDAFKVKMESGVGKDDMYNAIAAVNNGKKSWMGVHDVDKAKEILDVVTNFGA